IGKPITPRPMKPTVGSMPTPWMNCDVLGVDRGTSGPRSTSWFDLYHQLLKLLLQRAPHPGELDPQPAGDDVAHDTRPLDRFRARADTQLEFGSHRIHIRCADVHPAEAKHGDLDLERTAHSLAVEQLVLRDDDAVVTPSIFLHRSPPPSNGAGRSRDARKASSVQASCTSSWRRT